VQDDGRYDLSDARRFGELVVLFKKDLYPDDANDGASDAMRRAYDTLHDFDPEADYLCLIGSPLYVAMCSYALGDLGKQPVRLLRYDRLESCYYEIKLQ
jgi:hypothetical protein